MKDKYLKNILKAASKGTNKPGQITHVEVLHDDDCPFLQGKGACSCEPEIKVMNARDFN